MWYRTLGGYGSPYEKLMTGFIIDRPLALRHYITMKTGYCSLGMEASIGI